ncbi:ABC transporter ATP-binding protein [Cohnella sp. CFH 77786]|uniref:ABC transporter ATP-binding protein n=1 Tax=Cohnella sp. CFH 77786 TaxID=2662265 RepID=UPI001C60E695|nr:ABC transporter ATP-binding protein [Cohnella sp. CFH 77786]
MIKNPVLQISGLSVALRAHSGSWIRHLVQGINLTLYPGEMHGLVGESGSGKSITASAVLGLLPGSLGITEGEILLNGKAIHRLPEKAKRRLRGREMACIFQNDQGSFAPFRKIGKQLTEALQAHEKMSSREAREISCEWLERVKLPAQRVFDSYPFQLSGGQLQRTSLAASLMMKPSLIIADEPTTALDVLTAEQILDLLSGLQKKTECAVLLISHDLTSVLKRTDRMSVMYGGHLMESGPTASVRRNPLHPYTKMLLKARPPLDGFMPDRLAAIPGEPGAVADQGCPFAPRCPYRKEACVHMPASGVRADDHSSACLFADPEGGDSIAAVARSDQDREVVWR